MEHSEHPEPLYKIGQQVRLRKPPAHPDRRYTNDFQEEDSLHGLLYTDHMASVARGNRIYEVTQCVWRPHFNAYVYHITQYSYAWLEGWLRPAKELPQISDNLLTRLLFISGMKEDHE